MTTKITVRYIQIDRRFNRAVKEKTFTGKTTTEALAKIDKWIEKDANGAGAIEEVIATAIESNKGV